MWKKTGLLLCMLTAGIFSQTIWAEPTQIPNIGLLKQQWQKEQQQAQKQLQRQRTQFLQLESLLQTAERQRRVTPKVLQLAEGLFDPTYPLNADAEWAILKAKLASLEQRYEQQPEQQSADIEQDLNKVRGWITDFSAKFPDIAKRQKLAQRLFKLYYDQQKFAELIAYAKTVTPDATNQCHLFSAQFQQLAEQSAINPEAEQAEGVKPLSDEMQALLIQFDTMWLQRETLSKECEGIEAYWRDQGFKTDEKVRAKAVKLFEKKAKSALETLSQNASPAIAEWLEAVQRLLASPNELPIFAEKQPLDLHSKAVLLSAFPLFIKTLPEQLENPDFSVYQQWAARWQLSDDEIQQWKATFVSRLFDNHDPIFQLWRDEQIKQFKRDNLTERRLRVAISQKTALDEWLDLLSDEAKAKAEWRYWAAKSDPKQRKKGLEALAKERGFYPMLAANALNIVYQPTIPQSPVLTDSQKIAFKQPLERIAELRALGRFSSAKVAWIDLLQAVSFEEKLALADYSLSQEWADLAVEATIQAKAWDYLPLRLPNAYADWFALNLQGRSVSQSFAMAIARQESAWNADARSHANAMGLMQMLPTTAAATAKNSELPYRNEQDLLVPFKNIMLGTAHLDELNQKYPNNRILIASAYNAGASRVEKWLAQAGGKLAMDEFIASIPFYETRGYVQNVLAYDFYYQILYGSSLMMFSPEEQRMY